MYTIIGILGARAPNIFHIQVAAILEITTKIQRQDGEHWEQKNLVCDFRGFIIFKQQLKELEFCCVYIIPPSVLSFLLGAFFFHFKFKFWLQCSFPKGFGENICVDEMRNLVKIKVLKVEVAFSQCLKKCRKKENKIIWKYKDIVIRAGFSSSKNFFRLSDSSWKQAKPDFSLQNNYVIAEEYAFKSLCATVKTLRFSQFICWKSLSFFFQDLIQA